MKPCLSPRFRRRIATLVAMLIGVFVVSCETPPPAPRALVITAQRGQSQAQQDRDKSDCQSMSSAQANSSESWAQIFAACMNGRGYLVQ
jgi:hypothetical protein